MSKSKSPLDNLFFELYGYYPNKAGQAYEILVSAALKLATGQDHKYDQHLKGEYSKTDYQIDGLNLEEAKIVEAKDYTINDRKVGRPDLQKLQGALSDLQVKSGVFASATDYTKPAKKYSESSNDNPLQKQIELYEIRPSTELDEEGRLKKFIINMTMVVPDYSNGKFDYAWTDGAIKKFEDKELIGKDITMILDRFYKSDGTIDFSLLDFTKENQPLLADIKDGSANGCWLLHNKFILYDDELFEIKGIEYEIPYNRTTTTFTIESEGKPKILIKSDDGKINKLLTDEQFKALTFIKGEIK